MKIGKIPYLNGDIEIVDQKFTNNILLIQKEMISWTVNGMACTQEGGFIVDWSHACSWQGRNKNYW